jgi:hypothetical protein
LYTLITKKDLRKEKTGITGNKKKERDERTDKSEEKEIKGGDQ